MKDFQVYYLIISIGIWLLGYVHTGKFVRPKWKIPGKFIFYVGVSFALVHWFGHWGVLFIIGHPLIGLLFHTKICKAHNINWFTCEPKEKYMELQEKWAKGDFTASKRER